MRFLRRAFATSCLIFATTFTTSCITTGKNFPTDISWLKKDVTKKQDVLLLLGEPFAVGNSGGDPTWSYTYYKYQVAGKNLYKELKLYWNPNGTVKHFNFNTSFPVDLEKAGASSRSGQGQRSSSPDSEYPNY